MSQDYPETQGAFVAEWQSRPSVKNAVFVANDCMICWGLTSKMQAEGFFFIFFLVVEGKMFSKFYYLISGK